LGKLGTTGADEKTPGSAGNTSKKFEILILLLEIAAWGKPETSHSAGLRFKKRLTDFC